MINEQTNKYVFHIGSNNDTKRREIKKACELVGNFTDGFNTVLNFGVWKRQKENSFKIEVLQTNEKVNDRNMFELKKILEVELKQYLVILEKQKISLLN